jgi:ubiquinone biosynthesis protein UbiJ
MTIVDLANQAVTSLQDGKEHLAEMLGESITENLWLEEIADRMFDETVSLRQACDRLAEVRI